MDESKKQLLERDLREKLSESGKPIQDYYRRISGKSINTKLSYYTNFNLFVRYLASNFKEFEKLSLSNISYDILNQINIDHVDRFKEYLLSYEYSNEFEKIKRTNKTESINTKLAAIKSLYSNLYEIALSRQDDGDDRLTHNISGLIKLEKTHVKIKNTLKTNEFLDFLKIIEKGKGEYGSIEKSYQKTYKTRNLAIVSLLGETGMRISELCNINIKDLNFAEKSIIITRKGGKQEQVYFDFSLQYLKNYYSERVIKKTNSEAFFISNKNSRITPRGVQLMLEKYAKITTEQKITPHTLRRSFATNIYEMTGDAYLVASLIGDTVNVTTKHYTFQSDKRKKDAIENYLKGEK